MGHLPGVIREEIEMGLTKAPMRHMIYLVEELQADVSGMRQTIADQQRRIAELDRRLNCVETWIDADEANEPEDGGASFKEWARQQVEVSKARWNWSGDEPILDWSAPGTAGVTEHRPTPVDDPNNPARRRR